MTSEVVVELWTFIDFVIILTIRWMKDLEISDMMASKRLKRTKRKLNKMLQMHFALVRKHLRTLSISSRPVLNVGGKS